VSSRRHHAANRRTRCPPRGAWPARCATLAPPHQRVPPRRARAPAWRARLPREWALSPALAPRRPRLALARLLNDPERALPSLLPGRQRLFADDFHAVEQRGILDGGALRGQNKHAMQRRPGPQLLHGLDRNVALPMR